MLKQNIKQKLLKYFILPMFVLTFIFLVGCSNTSNNNTFNTISSNMKTLIQDINKIEIIETSELIIDDFMDENNLTPKDNVPALYEQTDAMYTYLTKLTLLNNTICNTIEINNNLNNSIMQTIAKAHQTKSLSDQCLTQKCKLSNSSLDTLKELNNSIMENNSRIYLTKNEVKNTLAGINKKEYNNKPEQLSSKYERLQIGLNTRLIYLNNISKGLDSISYILASCSNLNENNTCENCDDIVKATTKAQNNSQTQKKIKKNIDTYENAGRDINGMFKNAPYYNQDNYLNGYYGYNRYPNNYYGMGYGNMYGYGMPFGYGMTPFGFNGGGYMFPNINTFGSYKNIDTYKSPKAYKEENNRTNNNQSNNEDNYIKDNNDEIVEAQTRAENLVPHKQPKPMPKPNHNKHRFPHENVLDNPYIKPVKPEEAIKENTNDNEDKNKNEDIMTLPLFDEDAKVKDNNDEEDTFVVLNPEKPTIEKLDK